MEYKISLVEKACKDCGKHEMMAPSCERCLECRIKRMKENSKKYKKKNAEKIRKDALASYYMRKQKKQTEKIEKEKNLEKEKPQSNFLEIKRIFPVRYIEKGGKYYWRVRQFNKITNRFFIWESDKEFDTLLEAQQDYCAATR